MEKKDYIAEAKSIVSKDKRDVLLLTTKASVNGSVAGLIAGMMIAHYQKRSIYLYGLIGCIVGGATSAILVHRK